MKPKDTTAAGANPMNRGGWGSVGRPVEKAKDFKGTLTRLLRYFLPEKVLLSVVLGAAILGTVFNIVGPKILGLATTKLFNDLIARGNIDKLIAENGLCIVYTHFAKGFLEKDGEINRTFKENIDYLSSQNGWFAPVTEILDYLLESKRKNTVNLFYINLLDFKWLIQRIRKKIKYGR